MQRRTLPTLRSHFLRLRIVPAPNYFDFIINVLKTLNKLANNLT